MDPLRLSDISLIACVHGLLTEHADYASELKCETDTEGFEERIDSPVEMEVVEMEKQLIKGFEECASDLEHEIAERSEEANDMLCKLTSNECSIKIDNGNFSDSDINPLLCHSSKASANESSSDANLTEKKTDKSNTLIAKMRENSKEELTSKGPDKDKDFDESVLSANEFGSDSMTTTMSTNTSNSVASESNRKQPNRSMYVTRMLETGCFTAVSEDILKRMVKYCPHRITSRLLKALVPPYAKELHLHGCTTFRLMAMVDVFERCRHLQHLNLVQCSQVIHPDVFVVAQLYNLPLTTVILEENSDVNDEVVHSLVKNLPSLSTLNVSSCSSLSNKAFLVYEDEQRSREVSPFEYNSAVYTPLSSLTNVDVSGCRALNTEAVHHLVSLAGPTLQHVNISWTSVDCLSLLYLAGYSLPAVITFLLSDRRLKTDRELTNVLEQYSLLGECFSELAADPGKEKPIDGNTDGMDGSEDNPMLAGCSGTLHEENDTRELTEVIRKCNAKILETGTDKEGKDRQQMMDSLGQCMGDGDQLETKTEESDEQIFRDLVDHVQDIGDNFLQVISEIEAANLFGAQSHESDTEEDHIEEKIHYAHENKQTVDTNYGNRYVSESYKDVTEKRSASPKCSIISGNSVKGSIRTNTGLESELKEHVIETDENNYLQDTISGFDCLDVRETDIEHIDFTLREKSRDSVSDSGIYDGEESVLTNVGDKTTVSSPCDMTSEGVDHPHTLEGTIPSHSTCTHVKNDSIEQQETKSKFITTSKETGDVHLSGGAVVTNDHNRSIGAMDESLSVIGTAKTLELRPSSKACNRFEFHTTSGKGLPAKLGEGQAKVSDEESAGLGDESDEVSEADDDYECDLDSCKGVKDNAESMPVIVAEGNDYLLSALNGSGLNAGSLKDDEGSVEDENKRLDCEDEFPKLDIKAELDGDLENKAENHFQACNENGLDHLEQIVDADMVIDAYEQYGLEHLEITEVESEANKGTKHRNSDEDAQQEAFTLNIPYDKQLFKPQIQSLNITEMKFLSKNPYLGQACLSGFLQANTTLQRFSVSWRGLSYDCFKKMLVCMANLRDVELYDCTMLQNPGVQALGTTCPKLEDVNLRGVVFISDYALLPYLKLEHLNKLSLAESDHITDRILKLIATHLASKLKDLDLSWCEEITEKGVNAICESCYKLTRLIMRKCPVSDTTLRLLGETASDLESLSIETVDADDDISFSRMAGFIIGTHLKKLRILDISWNLCIEDDSVAAILQGCNKLEEAYFRGLKLISIDPFLPMICDNDSSGMCGPLAVDQVPFRSSVYAPNLRVLDLDYCDIINDQLLQRLVKVCRGTLHVTDYYSQTWGGQ